MEPGLVALNDTKDLGFRAPEPTWDFIIGL